MFYLSLAGREGLSLYMLFLGILLKRKNEIHLLFCSSVVEI